MIMTITEYIEAQPADRQALLQALHTAIVENDSTVTPTVGPMMSKQMILYNCKTFKYGLASVKDYMSLHVMPMYMNAPMHQKYEALLPKAKFQKGCINFKNADEMPVDVVKQLIADSAGFDLHAYREKYLAEKKKK